MKKKRIKIIKHLKKLMDSIEEALEINERVKKEERIRSYKQFISWK